MNLKVFIYLILSFAAVHVTGVFAEKYCTEYKVRYFQCSGGSILERCKGVGECANWVILNPLEGQSVENVCVKYEKSWHQSGPFLQGYWTNDFCTKYTYGVVGKPAEKPVVVIEPSKPEPKPEEKPTIIMPKLKPLPIADLYTGATLSQPEEAIRGHYCHKQTGLVMGGDIVYCLEEATAIKLMDSINQCPAIAVPTYLIPGGKEVSSRYCPADHLGVVVDNRIASCFETVRGAIAYLQDRRGCASSK